MSGACRCCVCVCVQSARVIPIMCRPIARFCARAILQRHLRDVVLLVAFSKWLRRSATIHARWRCAQKPFESRFYRLA